jgi:hypothetical protein
MILFTCVEEYCNKLIGMMNFYLSFCIILFSEPIPHISQSKWVDLTKRLLLVFFSSFKLVV